MGADYGTTTGVLYTDLYRQENSPNVTVELLSTAQDGQVVHNPKQCTDVSLSLYSDHTPQSVVLFISTVYSDTPLVIRYHKVLPDSYSYNDGKYCFDLLVLPIIYNITLLPCPPGFILLNKRCDCHLHYSLFDSCKISNGTGYFSWNSNAWTTIHKAGILYDMHCPFDYCNITGQLINLLNDSDSQCAFNRAGRLCGGCRENYSLAIGSSHCIQCPNNDNLALVILFAAAGFILVFFITALNLTVSQGMVNGLIFYTNVVWTYQSIFFSKNQENYSTLIFLRTFTAWVNLDFGIEACFFNGLTAFWKAWLQFIFPFYIWAIAGLIIVASRYSTRLTNLLGNRAVPVLCSLFLLSYIKLLRLVVTALEFSILTFYLDSFTKTHSLVWSVDGNLSYFGFPHILLFIAGLATLLILCLPYTLLLLFMQLIRRLPHFKLINWIMQFHPVYDAYFAPLKHKHQYWFGVLLLARVILLMTFVSTFAIPQYINLLILLILVTSLTFYIAVVQPYRSTSILTLQTSFLVNLAILSGFVTVSSLSNRPTLHSIAVGISTGVAFIQFCGIVLYAIVTIIRSRLKRVGYCNHENMQEEDSTDFIDDHDRDIAECDVINGDEVQPLLSVVSNVPTY